MYLGIDIGSLAAKCVLVDADGTMVAWAILPSGHDHRGTAEALAREVLDAAGIGQEAILGTVGTGYGRASVPFNRRTVTEITCHAQGAVILEPGCRTVIDIGGQDSKAILLDARGGVRDFVMNDRCAAGTGRFLEVMSKALHVPLDEMGTAARTATQAARISNVCTVFAESEIVGLIANGASRPNIVRGICAAIAERVAGMIDRMGLETPVILTGGVARNEGVVAALEARLGVKVGVPPLPQIAGALGAAHLALCGDRANG